MNVIQTAKNGVVNNETVFQFTQDGKKITARYSGGKIQAGYLVGILVENVLNFTYCQLRTTGELDHGESRCILSVDQVSKKLKLEERFKMKTKTLNEEGVNIFMEL